MACALRMIAIAVTMAAAVATEGKCATFGCSMHKDPAHSCQCNLHCAAHKDCCPDYATACTANGTDASSELHGSKGPRPSSNSTKKERSKPASPSPESKHQHPKHETANRTDHDAKHAPTASPAHEGESSGSSSSSSQHSGSGKGSSKTASGGGSDGGSSKSSEHGKNEEHSKDKEGKDKEGKDKEGKDKEGKEKAHEHEHKSGQKHHGAPSSANIAIVVLACISGITVPVTISIVLVLRSRGICCVGTKFHRIDRPPVTPTESAVEAAPAASMAAAAGAPFGA